MEDRDMKYCKLCLVTDVKMFSMNTPSIVEAYSQLVHVVVCEDYQTYACYECMSLLRKYQEFRWKCVTALNVLSSFNMDHSKITKEIVQNIDRQIFNLESKLSYCSILICNSNDQMLLPRDYGTEGDLLKNCVNSKLLESDMIEIKIDPCDPENDTDDQIIVYNSDDSNRIHAHNIPDIKNKTDVCYPKNDTDDQIIVNDNNFSNEIHDKSNEIFLGLGAYITNNDYLPPKKEKRKSFLKKCKGNATQSSADINWEEHASDFDDDVNQDNGMNRKVASSAKCKTDYRKSLQEKSKGNSTQSSAEINRKEHANDVDDEVNQDNEINRKEGSGEGHKSDCRKSFLKKCKGNANKSNTDINWEEHASDVNDELVQDNEINRKETLADKFKNDYEEYATLVYLTPEDAKMEILLRKESLNYKRNPHKCDFCCKGFTLKSTFENHMKKHNPEYGSWECEYCHQRFLTKTKLRVHVLQSHERKYSCKFCPYVCYGSNQAFTHINRHKGRKYECRECGLSFSMPNTLSSHKRVKHPRDVVCALCGSTFAALPGLHSHQRLSHGQDNVELVGPKCLECDVQFATETAWKRHLVLSSKHTVLNGCQDCGKIFDNEADLRKHSKLHPQRNSENKVRPATCKICDKWLQTRKEYKDHMKSQHPHSDKKIDSSSVCEVCGLAFKANCHLRIHQLKHTGERPYECHDCGKRFQQRGTLSQHVNLHTRKGVFQCDTCQKLFKSKNGLVKHVKIHLGIRPYECPLCHKCFPYKCEMRMHVDYVHNKVPWPKRDRTKRRTNKQIAASIEDDINIIKK